MSESQTPETDEMGNMRRTVTEWRNLCENLERERNGLQKAYDCALRRMNEAIASAGWHKSENAKLRKQIDETIEQAAYWKREYNRVHEQWHEDAAQITDLQQLATDMRDQRDNLATACEHIAHSKLPADQLEQFAIDALAAVNKMETNKRITESFDAMTTNREQWMKRAFKAQAERDSLVKSLLEMRDLPFLCGRAYEEIEKALKTINETIK